MVRTPESHNRGLSLVLGDAPSVFVIESGISPIEVTGGAPETLKGL